MLGLVALLSALVANVFAGTSTDISADDIPLDDDSVTELPEFGDGDLIDNVDEAETDGAALIENHADQSDMPSDLHGDAEFNAGINDDTNADSKMNSEPMLPDQGETMLGGDGSEGLTGASGHDWICGRDGDDTIGSAAGDDTLNGGRGDDSLNGGAGSDVLFGFDGDDSIIGGVGNDLMFGEAGSDQLFGGEGSDTIWGQDEYLPTVDTLTGGAGDDMLALGAGDTGYGGDGADTFVIDQMYLCDDAASIADFVPSTDSLLVLYDPSLHPNPVLSLESTPDGDGVTLMLDGVRLAYILGGNNIDLNDIQLQELVPGG